MLRVIEAQLAQRVLLVKKGKLAQRVLQVIEAQLAQRVLLAHKEK